MKKNRSQAFVPCFERLTLGAIRRRLHAMKITINDKAVDIRGCRELGYAEIVLLALSSNGFPKVVARSVEMESEDPYERKEEEDEKKEEKRETPVSELTTAQWNRILEKDGEEIKEVLDEIKTREKKEPKWTRSKGARIVNPLSTVRLTPNKKWEFRVDFKQP